MNEKRKERVLKSILKWVACTEKRGERVTKIVIQSFSSDPYREVEGTKTEFGVALERIQPTIEIRVEVSSVKELLKVWKKVVLLGYVSERVVTEKVG